MNLIYPSSNNGEVYFYREEKDTYLRYLRSSHRQAQDQGTKVKIMFGRSAFGLRRKKEEHPRSLSGRTVRAVISGIIVVPKLRKSRVPRKRYREKKR